MMHKWKTWLYSRFLPEYCRQSLLEENARLENELKQKQQRIQELNSYIDGMEAGMHSLRRITICNHTGKGDN